MEERKLSSVIVWICPACSNYYASSSAGNLVEKWNQKLNGGGRTFNRATCPDCRRGGDLVERVPIICTPKK